MKTKEELNELKEEVETLSKKLHELTEEELAQVSGGLVHAIRLRVFGSPDLGHVFEDEGLVRNIVGGTWELNE